MCQLVAQKSAARILGQRRLTLLDRSIDYLKIPFNDRDSRRIELCLSLRHDLLEHVDLSAVDSVRLLLLDGETRARSVLPRCRIARSHPRTRRRSLRARSAAFCRSWRLLCCNWWRSSVLTRLLLVCHVVLVLSCVRLCW